MDRLIYNVKSLLFGVAIGDALGVPVEFISRDELIDNPVIDMLGYGTHNQPPGTWSDDSSLTFCLAEALIEGFDLNKIAQKFVNWYFNDYWTPRGKVFDIGNTTKKAIERLANGVSPYESGFSDNFSLGNGSLMRISPLVFYLFEKSIEERFELTKLVSSLTHSHSVAVLACFYYLEYARLLLLGVEKFKAYKSLKTSIYPFFENSLTNDDIKIFDRLINDDISRYSAKEIYSTGYVIHTLEASIWSILTTDSFVDAVLKAVNLGDDSDTTGAVTGALAGLLYGLENIPDYWIKQLARYQDIEDLAERFAKSLLK